MITVHILDRDVARGEMLARRVSVGGMHAERYESLSELIALPPRSGVLLASDDLHGPGMSAILAAMEQGGFLLPVGLYADAAPPERIVDAMLSGALDYLVLPIGHEALARSVSRLDDSGRSAIAKRRKEVIARALVSALSAREREVLRELVMGAASKAIAATLGISVRTVEIHRAAILRKLAAGGSADAVRIGLLAGIAD
jgi:two-component system response regulator FixJ